MQAAVSPVMPHGDSFRLSAYCGAKSKGYEFKNRKECVKARARLIKRLKRDGFKIIMLSSGGTNNGT